MQEQDMDQVPEAHQKKNTLVITISSGKGGVGKTNAAVNIAICMSRMGKKVCVFDADLGLANINILLGIQPEYDITHVVSGKKTIREIIIEGPEGIYIIPASSGVEQIANLNEEERERLILNLGSLENKFDVLLIDTAAGISSNVLCFLLAGHKALVVLTPEPTSLTDAYAVIKVLSMRGYKKPVSVLVNMVSSKEVAIKIYKKMEEAVKRFLKMEIHFAGFVLLDKKLPDAVMQQKPICILDAKSIASRCFAYIAGHIINDDLPTVPQADFLSFWRRVMRIVTIPIMNIKRNKPGTKNSHIVEVRPQKFNLNDIKNIIRSEIDLDSSEESETKLKKLYDYIKDIYAKRFNKSIEYKKEKSGQEPEIRLQKAPIDCDDEYYNKFKTLIDKMETILEGNQGITNDLTRIKNDGGRYTSELWKLINYINAKSVDIGEGIRITPTGDLMGRIYGMPVDRLSNVHDSSVVEGRGKIEDKNQLVRELNFEDIV